jgi:hypothetical protein
MRVDVFLHSSDSQRLENIEHLLRMVLKKEISIMALGQDILDAVTAETSSVDSFIALVQGLIDNGTVPASVGAAIMAAVNSNKAKLDAAILANTPQAPPVA